MSFYARTLLILFFAFASLKSDAQEDKRIDSFKLAATNSPTIEGRIQALDILSRMLMNINLEEAEKYGKQLISVAEESRNRKLMIKAYLSNGLRCSYLASRKEFTDRSIEYYKKALDIAVKNEYQDKIAVAYMRLSSVYLTVFDKDNALKYASQAFSIITNVDDDSLKAESYKTYGNVYLARKEKKLALQSFLNALRIAEDSKNNALMKDCYLSLSAFYSDIEDYDKAIDYYMLAFKKLDLLTESNVPYQRTIYLTNIGNLYAAKKSTDIAIDYYNRSIAMADSFKLTNLAVPGYFGLFNQYLQLDQSEKALAYFNSEAGTNLKNYLNKLGFSGVIDQAYAVIYTGLNKYDSAKKYFEKAEPFFEHGASEVQRMNFYAMRAQYYQQTGDYNKAIELYLKVKSFADAKGMLEQIQLCAKHLDSLYVKTGNYQLASQYNSIYYKYKDSSETINKEKELAQVEAADVQQRLQKEEKKREEQEIRNHNIQYMAITIGIALLFVILVFMGIFKVSVNTIKILGFFAFIMFFEFIILIADNKIHHLTHGEPWKVLAIKIILIAMLLPLHHWLEHKVIHYLTSHNKLTAAGSRIRKILGRNKSAEI